MPSPSNLSEDAGRAGEVLVVRVLGCVEIQVGDRTVGPAQWKYARGRDLLLYLACVGRASRGKLGEAFWPGVAAENQRNSLNVCLHWLRRALGAHDWVLYRGGAYELNPARTLHCDLHAFERLLVAADCAHADPAEQLRALDAALALVRGPVLDDVVEGQWHQPLRVQVQRRMEEARLRAGNLGLACGDAQGAARRFEAVLVDDALNEAAVQGLMRAQAAQGALADLVHSYAALHTALNEELGVSPTAATRALYTALVEELGGYAP